MSRCGLQARSTAGTGYEKCDSPLGDIAGLGGRPRRPPWVRAIGRAAARGPGGTSYGTVPTKRVTGLGSYPLTLG
jgi:hypothetical protein